VRISDGAHSHGITDEDMLHAARNAISQSIEEDGFTMLIGPARDGSLLEVGFLDINSDDPVIIHAMKALPKNLP
jgi:hypothetical protein